jgi:uncharacterized membrane protein YjgN (DUF898 family)
VTYSGRGGGLFPRFLGAIGLTLLVVIVAGILVFAIFSNMMPLIFQGQGTAPNFLAMLAPFLLGFAFYVPVVAVMWWYRAGELRYFASHTSLAGVRFSSDFTTGGFMWLWSTNSALLLLTLGLAYAWVVVRTARFFSDHIHLEGELDLEAIQQTAQQAPSSGEGLAEALDLGGI